MESNAPSMGNSKQKHDWRNSEWYKVARLGSVSTKRAA